jgi:hypothetical protein
MWACSAPTRVLPAQFVHVHVPSACVQQLHCAQQPALSLVTNHRHADSNAHSFKQLAHVYSCCACHHKNCEAFKATGRSTRTCCRVARQRLTRTGARRRFASRVLVQAGRTELVANLQVPIGELLRAFSEQNDGLKPEAIVFFRDGVSEGEYDQVGALPAL